MNAQNDKTKVHVGNLAFWIDEHHIALALQQFGQVRKIEKIADHYAFVEFFSVDDAERAIRAGFAIASRNGYGEQRISIKPKNRNLTVELSIDILEKLEELSGKISQLTLRVDILSEVLLQQNAESSSVQPTISSMPNPASAIPAMMQEEQSMGDLIDLD